MQWRTKSAKTNKFVKWVTNLSAYTKNKTINALVFFLAVFIIGGTNYFLMFHVFVPTFFLLDLLLIVLLLSPIFFFKKTMFDRIYLPIIIGLLTVFYTLNSMFYDYFGTVFSLKDFVWAISNAKQVGIHAGSIKWWILILNVVLFLIFGTGLVLYNALWRFKETNAELRIKGHRKIAFALAMLFGSMVLLEFSLQMWCLGERKKGIDDIDYVNYSANYHFKRLGMIGYYVQETRQICLDKGESITDIQDYLNSASYLENDYTGFFKKQGYDKTNVMVIMIETGDLCMVNESSTPNLWRLLNGDASKADTGGLNCNFNYSYNHTNESDMIGINGNYPLYHFDKADGIKMPFNIPSILKASDEGYQSYFASDLAKSNDIYDTMHLMRQFGFDRYLFHDDTIPNVEPWAYEKSNFTRDSIFMDGLLNKIKDFPSTNPFYMQYVTIHMHMDQVLTNYNQQMYEDLEREFGNDLDKPGSKWSNPFDPNSEDGKRFRRFSLKAHDFDYGLGKIMDYLYNTPGRDDLKNTMLVVFGDHSWYENCQSGPTFAQKLRNRYTKDDIKQYSTVLGFYHPILNKWLDDHGISHTFNKPTWPTVIAPTILHLLGETYNPRLYPSKSLFDETYDDNEIFYSYWLSIYLNEHYTSQDHHNITTIYDDNNTKEEFINRLKDLRYRMRIIDTIYKRNLFSKYNYEEFMPKQEEKLC